MTQQPNIVYLHSHDTGQYIQPYGYPVSTPNLQKLAEEGVVFRNSFTVSPTCSPSRAALLTGLYPHNNGMTGLAHRGWSLNDYDQHLAARLSKHGYATALLGVQHIAKFFEVDRIGYGLAQPFLNTEGIIEAASDYFSNPPEQPFFLSIGFYETHRDFHSANPDEGGSREDPRYVRPPAHLPDTGKNRQDTADFAASVRNLDIWYGRVLSALAESGLAENTLVICTTDHGLAFPGMKCTLTDRGTGVLLIMRGPGGFTGGRVVDAIVTQLDIVPTVFDLLGLELPEDLQGSSLLPLVRELAEQIHTEVYGEVNYHAAYDPQRSIRTTRFKYIRRFSERNTPTLANSDDGPSKQEWLDHGWQDQKLPEEMLYDLMFDPAEGQNLVDDENYTEILEELRSKLIRWMEDTGDPLLTGPVPAPEGAEVNLPEAISPEEPTRPA